jgi:hypothetical protein
MKTTIIISGLVTLFATTWHRQTEPVTATISDVSTTVQHNTSEEPIETINRWFARFKAGASAEELAGFYAEDAVMTIPGDVKNIPWIGIRTGRKEIADHYKLLRKDIRSEKLTITDMLTKGNRVVVLGKLESRYLVNNQLMKSDFCMDIIVENGQIKSYNFLEDSWEVAQKVKGKTPVR